MNPPTICKRSSHLIFIPVLGMMLLLAWTGNTAAEDAMGQNLFALGNEAYVKGDYDQAIAHYKGALDRDGYTPSLLYNLGNAYYMNNEIGQSILNYQRALYLDPGNVHIKENLALARKKAGLGIPEQTSWMVFFKHLTLNGWTWAGVIALCTFSMMTLINGLRPGTLKGPATKITGCICFLLFIAAGTGVAVQYENLNRGVVTGENSRLRVSPFDSAADSGVVKNGKEVNLGDTYEGYVFVQEPNGQSGWIPENTVDAILPTDHILKTKTSTTQSTIGKINGRGAAPNINKT